MQRGKHQYKPDGKQDMNEYHHGKKQDRPSQAPLEIQDQRNQRQKAVYQDKCVRQHHFDGKDLARAIKFIDEMGIPHQ